MKILKRYREPIENDDIDGNWHEETEADCLNRTEGAGYWKPGTVLNTLKTGQIVFTPFAEYKVDSPFSL